jgi:hypothetical protein
VVIRIRPTLQRSVRCAKPLRPISHEGSIFYDGLPIFDYTTQLIRTPELGVEVAKSLGIAAAF